MPDNRVRVALAHNGEHLLHRREAVHRLDLRDARLILPNQQIFRPARHLHRRAAARQISQIRIGAVRAHHRHQTAEQVESRPCVLVLAAVHHEPAPQAVHRAVCQRFVLILPRHMAEDRLVAHAPESLARHFNVHALRRAIHVVVAVRLIFVAADDYFRQILPFLRPRRRQEEQRKQEKQRAAPPDEPTKIPFLFTHILVLMPAAARRLSQSAAAASRHRRGQYPSAACPRAFLPSARTRRGTARQSRGSAPRP